MTIESRQVKFRRIFKAIFYAMYQTNMAKEPRRARRKVALKLARKEAGDV